MIFGKMLNRLKERRGSLSDRVVEGIDMMGGMPRDMMPNRGSGIMEGMRNRRFFDRFRNRRPRPRPIRSIDKMPVMLEEDVRMDNGMMPPIIDSDKMPVMLEEDVKIASPDPMAGQPLPPGEPMPLPEPEPMDPNFGLPFDISLLRPEDRRRFLARQPSMENQLLPPDTRPILRPDLMPVKRSRFNEGGIASMKNILGESGRTLSNRDKMLARTLSNINMENILGESGRTLSNKDMMLASQMMTDQVDNLQNYPRRSAEMLIDELYQVLDSNNPEMLENSVFLVDRLRETASTPDEVAQAQFIERMFKERGFDMPQMSEGGAIKLSEQSVEFMPGTDIGIMLDEMSGLKKKAQMMS